MHAYLLGVEQPAWRDLLLDNGCSHLGMSYWSMRRRSRSEKARNRPLADRFPDEHDLLLESGGFQANSKPEEMSRGEWAAYGEEYARYALDNAERATLITEFDCLLLGDEWLEEQRRRFWSQLPPEKFVPVWHPEQGLAMLDRLAERYQRISVVESVLLRPGQTVAPQLRQIRARGIRTHGAALTKPETVERVPFDTVASSSWLSPSRFGDTIIWDGRRLHRYPNRMKETARGGRHRAWLESQGFDTAAIERGVNRELLRLAVWSWQEWAASVTARSSNWETRAAAASPPATAPVAVAGSSPNGHMASWSTEEREQVPLPVFGLAEKNAADDVGTELQMVTPGRSIRVCDTCAVVNCEARKPGASCAFSFPIELRTQGQMRAFREGLLEMMAQRVGFMRFNEERSGGYADENLGRELDRIWKALAVNAEIEDTRDSVKLSLEAHGQTPGLLSSLFGANIGARASQLPVPVSETDTDRIIEATAG